MLNMKECSDLVTNKIRKVEQRLEMYEPLAEGETTAEFTESDQAIDGEASLNLITELI